jgi:transposase
MLDALCCGTTDPEVLADLAHGKLRRKIPQLKQALEGRFEPLHALLVSSILAHLDFLDEQIERLSEAIEAQLRPFAAAVELLRSLDGIETRTAQNVLAEIGVDMSVFPTAGHLASWAGQCPGNDQSAGKRKSGKTRKGSKWLNDALKDAAMAAIRTNDSYLQAQYQRLRPRIGHGRAIGAVKHSIICACWHMLTTGELYRDLGGDYYRRQNPERQTRRLVAQLERLGHKVNLEQMPQAA